MATQLEIQTKNPLETAVDTAENQGGVGIQQTDADVFEAALAEAEAILESQRQAREVNPLVRVWRALVAFYDWVTGPAGDPTGTHQIGAAKVRLRAPNGCSAAFVVLPAHTVRKKDPWCNPGV